MQSNPENNICKLLFYNLLQLVYNLQTMTIDIFYILIIKFIKMCDYEVGNIGNKSFKNVCQ